MLFNLFASKKGWRGSHIFFPAKTLVFIVFIYLFIYIPLREMFLKYNTLHNIIYT